MTMRDVEYALTWQMTLAQGDGGPDLGGGGSGVPVGGNGSPPAGGGGGGGPDLLMPMILIFVVFLVWMMMSQRREKKKRDALISNIRKHDRVQTIGGIIGSVVEVKTQTVVVKVDESSNTRIEFAKSAIQQVIPDQPEAAKEPAQPAKA